MFCNIRKKFRFTMKILYVEVNMFKCSNIQETALEKDFIEQFLEAIMNQEASGFLCNLGIQYNIGKISSLFPLESIYILIN